MEGNENESRGHLSCSSEISAASMERIFAMNDSDDIVKEFLVESGENLDRLDRDLITLEKNPNDREILASIFRTIHTIKGTSGFLAFNQLGAVTHVGESLLGRLRDGQLELGQKSRALCWRWWTRSARCWRA